MRRPEQRSDAEAVGVFLVSDPRLLQQRVQFITDVGLHLMMAIVLQVDKSYQGREEIKQKCLEIAEVVLRTRTRSLEVLAHSDIGVDTHPPTDYFLKNRKPLLVLSQRMSIAPWWQDAACDPQKTFFQSNQIISSPHNL